MKNLIIIATMIFGFAAIGYTTSDISLDNMPKITFNKTTHDFGKMQQGDVVETDFYFVNEGNAPLVLSDVKASCGCTVPNWPKEPIAAGDSSKIHVKFNSRGKKGNFTKTITVKHNAESAVSRLIIKGFIEAPETPAESNPGEKSHDTDHNHSH